MAAHIPLDYGAKRNCIILDRPIYGDPGFAAITGNPEPTFAIDGWFSMELCGVSISLQGLS